jgi:hypothetical protein
MDLLVVLAPNLALQVALSATGSDVRMELFVSNRAAQTISVLLFTRPQIARLGI